MHPATGSHLPSEETALPLRGRTIPFVAFRASHPAKPLSRPRDLFRGPLKIMTERLLKLFPLLAVCSLAGCVSMPTGPSMMALPGNGRSFDEFRYDDYVCRQFAYERAGGAPSRASTVSGIGSAAVGAGLGAAAGAAFGGGSGAAIGAGAGMLAGGLAGANTARASGSISQRRYDIGYIQCMYAKGHRVPVSGQIQYTPSTPYSSAPSAPSAPSMPPPPPGRPQQALPPGIPPPPPGIPPPPPPQ